MIDFHNHIGINHEGTEGTAEELLSIMKTCGISRSVIFPIDSLDRGITYEKPNDQILSLCQKHPKKFIGFCRIQPKAKKNALRELERSLKNGHKGVKLHPYSEKFCPRDCTEIFDALTHYQYPVILHTEHRPERTPIFWQKTLEKYSDITFILAHSGKDFFREAGELARRLPNVYLDTSTLSYNRTRVLLDMAGAGKIVFASDYPYSRPELEKLKLKLVISRKRDDKLIFCENAKKILNMRRT